MRAYHFTGAKLRNGQPIPRIGKWLEHKGAIVACSSGLHASAHPFDALTYAPGPLLHLVELEGELVSHGSPVDKWAGRRRKIIASVDVTEICWYSARMFALSVAHLWGAPDVVLEFLFTGDKSLRAAARTAAWDAARAAAWDAARAAAWAAARDAAWAAAWDAARAAAWAAAIQQNKDIFASLVDAEFSEYL